MGNCFNWLVYWLSDLGQVYSPNWTMETEHLSSFLTTPLFQGHLKVLNLMFVASLYRIEMLISCRQFSLFSLFLLVYKHSVFSTETKFLSNQNQQSIPITRIRKNFMLNTLRSPTVTVSSESSQLILCRKRVCSNKTDTWLILNCIKTTKFTKEYESLMSGCSCSSVVAT